MNCYSLLIHSAEQIVQVTSKGERILKGERLKHVDILQKDKQNGGCSLIVGRDGRIVAIGRDSEILLKSKDSTFDTVIDATGKCLIPGLVDAHTHPVWAGDRVHEFAMKIAGASYMDIHNAGGGIGFTVKETRNASEDELYRLLENRIKRMVASGTTLVEAKTGYGLDAENEMKLIKVLNRAERILPVEMSITFLGAHSIPQGLNSCEATCKILKEQIPMVEILTKDLNLRVDNIDVFCEEGVFNVQQTEKILQAGQKLGLKVNFHGDELTPIGAAELSSSLGSVVISHLEEISDKGIESMAKTDSIAVLLPTTAFLLKLKPPPVRRMIDSGVVVALGTDFNPNCFCLSMPMAMHLACVLFGMRMEEALCAATINAAASLGRSNDCGSLEVGKQADIVVMDTDKWENLIYQFGGHDHLIETVIVKGKMIYSRK